MEEKSAVQRTFLRACLANGAMVALAFAIGWWAHGAPRVEAQSSNLAFFLQGMSPGTSLSLYYPNEQTIYVYPNVAVGNSQLYCAYQFQLKEPGGMIRREPCKPPPFRP